MRSKPGPIFLAVSFFLGFFLSQNPIFAGQKTILFSRHIPRHEVDFFASDIQKSLDVASSEELRSILGVQDISSNTLRNWLLERMGYVVGESDEVFNEKSSALISAPFEFDNPLPADGPVSKSSFDSVGISPGNAPVITMSNVGTTFYIVEKEQKILMGYYFPGSNGDKLIPITSPRVGLFQIGKGYFGMKRFGDPQTWLSRWFRLLTLFHEARHSDGRGKSLGFTHALCPPTKAKGLANKPYCDSMANGAYGLGAALMLQVREQCLVHKTCSAREAEDLAILALENKDRVLSDQLWDPTPEGKVSGNL